MIDEFAWTNSPEIDSGIGVSGSAARTVMLRSIYGKDLDGNGIELQELAPGHPMELRYF